MARHPRSSHEPSDRDRTLPVVAPASGICRHLRSKSMFIDVEPDPTIPSMSDGFVWCTHSMNCLGPDGRVADRDTCRHGRRCFDD